jgi:hydroxyisourate hydrolase
MTVVSTHVLDTARGRPAEGIDVSFEVRDRDGRWRCLAKGRTDADGRVGKMAQARADRGVHRLVFLTGPYLREQAAADPAFFPEVTVLFDLSGEERCHVPLLLGPYGYTTYRGS